MTYASGGLIQATDFNGLVNTDPVNLNKIWATGSNGWGYGQTSLSTVAAGGSVLASSWASAINTEKTIGNHQGTTLTAMTAPVTGDTVTFDSAVSTNLILLETNKFNAAAQGGTINIVSTSAVTWNDKLTFTMTANFASDNAVRYFFNSGGQLGLSASHPAGSTSSINQLISDICSDAGTVWLSSPTSGTVSLAGLSYNGVTKVGGANPAGATITTNAGFYALYSTPVQLFKQYSDFSYHSYTAGTFMSIQASYNGFQTVTFTVTFDEIPDGATVSTGTAVSLTVRYPSSTYLTNSWGTVGLTQSYVATDLPILEALVVGGGGAGGKGRGGGGGAGGFIFTNALAPATYTVVVGAGAPISTVGNQVGASGGDSSVGGTLLQAIGGGGGGGTSTATVGNLVAGAIGGSGGGGSGARNTFLNSGALGGTGTSGQGSKGGYSYSDGSTFTSGGGGGGADQTTAGYGGNASQANAGSGGTGRSSSINGTATYYAGGGGGGADGALRFVPGAAGLGGGGAGGSNSDGNAGTTNRGGGGGGGALTTSNGGAGGSGIVIIAYVGSVAKATGGTISTISRPGYVVHTFTTSGTFTLI